MRAVLLDQPGTPDDFVISDLPAVLQDVLDAVADGSLPISVHHVYEGLEQVPQAHRDMESHRAAGKLVVRVRH